MAAITYKNATCIYEGSDKLAVDSLNLDIPDGEFVVLVGPSGSGKSTALRMLAGLEDIDEGSIEIGGKNMTGVPSKDRDIAMVFQNYALYPNKTVAENMGFALKLRGVSADERRRKVEDAAKILDLTEFLDRKPAKLSGGQRQRVAMGRAIVREPQVFCMDEPLSNLDAKLRVQTRTQIAALQRRLGTTTVYVTHDQVEAMTMGDRVAVLRFGKLQQFASPSELYDRPANAFVAGFIGSPAMNLLTAPVVADGVRISEDSTLPLDREHLTKLHDAGRREGHARHPARGPRGLPAGASRWSIDLVEDLGSETYLYTHARSGRAVGRAVAVPHAGQAGRHRGVAQEARGQGAPVPSGDRRTHQLTCVHRSCGSGHRLPGSARAAVGPAAVGVERPRCPTARHRRRAQPPPGEVRRRRRCSCGRSRTCRRGSRPRSTTSCGGSRRWGCPRCVRRAWCCSPSSTPRSWSPATSRGRGSTAGCSCGCRRTSRSTGRDCWTRWPACWWSCTGTASSGVTARWPTRCSPATASYWRRGWSTPRPPRCIRR